MTKKQISDEEEIVVEYTAKPIARVARLRREAKTGSLRSMNKRRAINHGRRKNTVVGGIHLRGNKRTLH